VLFGTLSALWRCRLSRSDAESHGSAALRQLVIEASKRPLLTNVHFSLGLW